MGEFCLYDVDMRTLPVCMISLLLGLFLFVGGVWGASFLVNGGFENVSLSPWTKTVSTVLAVSDSTTVSEGSKSVSVRHSSGSLRGIEQIVGGVVEGTTYNLSAKVFIPSSEDGDALVRVAWYASSDGSGSQLSTSDTGIVSSTGVWHELSDSLVVPSGANSAKVRLYSRSGNSGDTFQVYWDEISFGPDEVAEVPEFGWTTGALAIGGGALGLLLMKKDEEVAWVNS